jgi:hypothetical protein
LYWKSSWFVGKINAGRILVRAHLEAGNLGNPNIQGFAMSTGKYSATLRTIVLPTSSGSSFPTKFFKMFLGPIDPEDKVTTVLSKVGIRYQSTRRNIPEDLNL